MAFQMNTKLNVLKDSEILEILRKESILLFKNLEKNIAIKLITITWG